MATDSLEKIFKEWHSLYTEAIMDTILTRKVEGFFIMPKECSCQHEWKEYIGFTEKFTYCTKCDRKKDQ